MIDVFLLLVAVGAGVCLGFSLRGLPPWDWREERRILKANYECQRSNMWFYYGLLQEEREKTKALRKLLKEKEEA